jgi:hypothetical protein
VQAEPDLLYDLITVPECVVLIRTDDPVKYSLYLVGWSVTVEGHRYRHPLTTTRELETARAEVHRCTHLHPSMTEFVYGPDALLLVVPVA